MISNRQRISLLFLIYVVLINQHMVRSIKEGIVVSLIGAEAISFIKLGLEPLIGLTFIAIYTKLCDSISPANMFTYIVGLFLLFFACFAFFIFPCISQAPVKVPTHTHQAMYWLVVISKAWPLVLFYAISDLWPIVIYSVLLWQLINRLTSLRESGKVYPLISALSQINLLLSGPLIIYFSKADNVFSSLFKQSNLAETAVQSMTTVILLSGVIAIILYRYLERYAGDVVYRDKLKPLTIKQNIQTIISSPYLCRICILMATYYAAIILIEGLWSHQIRQLYSSINHLINYQGKLLFCVGIVAIASSFACRFLMPWWGWRMTILLTPAVVAFLGICFFLAIINPSWCSYLSFSPLYISSFLGTLTVIAARALKYSLFDITKEMSYIPLESNLKIKGKAVAEISGVKLGKILGSGTQCLYFMLWPHDNYTQLAPVLLLIFVVICVIAVYNANMLATDYLTLANSHINTKR